MVRIAAGQSEGWQQLEALQLVGRHAYDHCLRTLLYQKISLGLLLRSVPKMDGERTGHSVVKGRIIDSIVPTHRCELAF